MSEKNDKFKRLAESRTNEILKKLKTLGNLANKSAYEYQEEEVNKIFSVIEGTTKEIKNKFRFSGKKDKYTFKL
jgi:hypothetical protein